MKDRVGKAKKDIERVCAKHGFRVTIQHALEEWSKAMKRDLDVEDYALRFLKSELERREK